MTNSEESVNRLQASASWIQSVEDGNNYSSSEGVTPPPSSHMRLGHGLANLGTTQKNVSCFGWSEPDLAKEEPIKQKMLSESDLFNVLDTPAAADSCTTAQVRT
jgi:hypothetical protein